LARVRVVLFGVRAAELPALGEEPLLFNITWGWYWLEAITGWVLAAIAVAGLANVIRRV
jgi:hypothetical protein